MRFALAALVLSLGIAATLAGCSQGGCEPATCLCADGTMQSQPSSLAVCATAPPAVVEEFCRQFACEGHEGVELPDAGED